MASPKWLFRFVSTTEIMELIDDKAMRSIKLIIKHFYDSSIFTEVDKLSLPKDNQLEIWWTYCLPECRYIGGGSYPVDISYTINDQLINIDIKSIKAKNRFYSKTNQCI